jgi:hypothetical protein
MNSLNAEPSKLGPQFVAQCPATVPLAHHLGAAARRGECRLLRRNGAALRRTGSGCPIAESAWPAVDAGTETDRCRETMGSSLRSGSRVWWTGATCCLTSRSPASTVNCTTKTTSAARTTTLCTYPSQRPGPAAVRTVWSSASCCSPVADAFCSCFKAYAEMSI